MEFPNGTAAGRKRHTVYATQAQYDYINVLLDRVGADLEDYTDTPETDLTVEEASEVIEAIKDDVGGYDERDD